MQGEVYVTVEADASTPMLMLEGSTNTGIFKKYKVHWSTPKGITGVSWPSTMLFIPNDETPVEVVNGQIQVQFLAVSQKERNTWKKCYNEI